MKASLKPCFRLALWLMLSINLVGVTVGHAAGLSAVQKIQQSLKLIDLKDDTYNAVIAISPNAGSQAKAIDRRGESLLSGMTILIKDNIDLLGLPTTAGSLALLKNYPEKDAPHIAQLKDAGAVILGKTNLSEWANFRSEKSSSGWSAVGGQTGNALDSSRSPCGSSSGSGVAVALGYVKVAIGTETHGSIICPASSNGVVGFKPTHGIVSGEGIVPLALSQDTAGPLADSIENASLVLSAMIDPKADNFQALVDGLQNLQSGRELKGMRIGVMASTLGYDSRRDELFNAAIDKLKASGVIIIDDIKLQPYEGFWDQNYQLLQYEFKRDLNAYFASRNNALKEMSLAKLIQFNQENAGQELKHFDQSIFEKSNALELTDKEYRIIRDKGHATTREQGLDKAFAEQKLDAIIGISGGPVWKIDHINGDSFFGPGMAGYPAVGGHPHVTIPGGKIAGMPMGMSFVGKRFQDHQLAQLIYRYMQL
ncbi:MAG: amidase [Arenicella sp.]|jgi:amidase